MCTRALLKVLLVAILAVDTSALERRSITVTKDGTGDFEKIRDAIDNAADTDEILVSPGTYNETIDFKSKAIQNTKRESQIIEIG